MDLSYLFNCEIINLISSQVSPQVNELIKMDALWTETTECCLWLNNIGKSRENLHVLARALLKHGFFLHLPHFPNKIIKTAENKIPISKLLGKIES